MALVPLPRALAREPTSARLHQADQASHASSRGVQARPRLTLQAARMVADQRWPIDCRLHHPGSGLQHSISLGWIMGNPFGYTYEDYVAERRVKILGPNHCFSWMYSKIHPDLGWKSPTDSELFLCGIMLTHRTGRPGWQGSRAAGASRARTPSRARSLSASWV
jgi:hypothetical protein